MKITLYTILIMATVLLVVGCTTSPTGEVTQELEELTVRLPVPFHDAAFGAYYIAKDKGYFAQEGLDVTLELGSPEANPIKTVVTGQNDIGVIGGPDTLLVARSKGHPLQAFALQHRYSDLPILMTLKESGITKVDQLEGKKVGFFYGHISTDVIRNLFRQEGVTVQEVDVGANLNQLLTKQVDAIWWFRIPAEAALPAKGLDLNIIYPRDYGITTHGYTLFATEKTIQERPEELEAFMRALIKAIHYVEEHPEEAIAAELRRDPKINEETELAKLLLYTDITLEPENLPIGYLNREMLEETYNRLEEEGVLEDSFDLSDAFTQKIIKAIYQG